MNYIRRMYSWCLVLICLHHTPHTAKKTSNSSLTERTVREQSTENILQRMREEKAEVPMNFPWDNIKLGKELGTGDFGKVHNIHCKVFS